MLMWHEEDHDRTRHALAKQLLDAAEREGLRSGSNSETLMLLV
jgi:hypothetical protein